MIKVFRSSLLLFLAFPGFLKAQDLNMYERGCFINKFDTLPYRILFPENFNPEKKYPLIIVLHGSGERGNDNNAQLKNGASLFLQVDVRKKFPAIVVFPQCSRYGSWWNGKIVTDADGKERHMFQVGGEPTKDMDRLLQLTDELLDKPYIDKHRVYIGGLSMGGMGTFEMLRRKTSVFAAAFAICGGDNSANVATYARRVPVWVFHGENDQVVPAGYSEIVVAAIRKAGVEPKFTLYENEGHECWNKAFAEPNLLPWLFSHKK